MNNTRQPVFDRDTFIINFQGIEDLAFDSAICFLQTLPELILSLETAIKKNNPKEIEVCAHTIKGSISNFYAEPARLAALKIEQMGHQNNLINCEDALNDLKDELIKLENELNSFINERKVA